MLYLVTVGTKDNLKDILQPFTFKDSLAAIANILVEFPTVDLGVKDYWLYACDMYDIFSEPVTVSVVSSVLGLEENSSEGINIYPIPASELITIEISKVGQYSIEITSLNGQLLTSGEMEGTFHQIDLSSFQKGVYFITIRSKNFVTTRKIIKL